MKLLMVRDHGPRIAVHMLTQCPQPKGTSPSRNSCWGKPVWNMPANGTAVPEHVCVFGRPGYCLTLQTV